MRVILTEKQFKEYIDHLINESVVCEKSDSESAKKMRDKLNNRLYQLLKTNKNLQNAARTMGVNPDYNSVEQSNVANTNYLLGGNPNDLNSKLLPEIKWAAVILHKYVGQDKNSRGKFDFDKLKEDYPADYNKLIHIKEFLDSKGLSFIYDKNQTPDRSNYSQIKSKTELDKLKQLGITSNKRNYFGLTKDNANDFDARFDAFNLDAIDDITNWDNTDKIKKGNKNVKLETPYYAKLKMKQNFLNAYLEKVYGLEAELPKEVFSPGNTKLPKGTLIINFSAAMQCPAWNECLLRNACYARSGEKRYGSVIRNSNVQRNLMWEAAHQDPEFLAMIAQLLRLYAFDYDKVVDDLKKTLNITTTPDIFSKKYFSELNDSEREILMKYKNSNHIRLNENGDFIGDWVISAIDNIAGDFKIMNISTSAYTCRNIKDEHGNSVYNKVANIILNVSNSAIKSNKVTRYFYAIEPRIYNLFDETYGGINNSLVVQNKTIKPNPQPLYKIDKETHKIVETGSYYYKCPCEREDTNGKKINCYECDICYQENTIDSKPYYVLVQVHSNGEKEALGIHMHGDIPQFGFSRNYLNNLKRIGGNLPDINDEEDLAMVSENEKILRESVSRTVRQGIIQVARNCVNSIKEHLNNLATQA